MRLRYASRSIPAAACLAILLPAAGCKQPEPLPPAPVPSVITAPVVKADGARDLNLSGTLSAERSIALGFATIGTVEQVYAQEGQAVAQGQLLATLSPKSYQDALGIAEVKAKQAEDAYRRLLPMHQNRTLPEVKFVEVETGREQARLAVSIARRSLADTELRAPVSGVVATRHAEPGTSATPGLPAFTLVQTGTMTATAPVPEMQVSKVRRGAAARVTVPAIERTFAGTVREIAIAANPLTRTYDIKVAVPNPGGELRVGMIADIHLTIGSGSSGGGERLAVPPEAVRVDEKGAPYVFVVTADRKLQRRPVTVDGFVGEATTLSGGVREGELVVTSGTPMLSEGLTVRVFDAHPKQVTR
jgi:membrane fusion protein, multidrug efflux system